MVNGSCAFADLRYGEEDIIRTSALFLQTLRANSGYMLFIYPWMYSRRIAQRWRLNVCARAYFVKLERLSSFIQTNWTKHAITHWFEIQHRANFYSTSGGIWRVYILSQLFVAGKISVPGMILSSSPYLRLAKARFPLQKEFLGETNTKEIVLRIWNIGSDIV